MKIRLLDESGAALELDRRLGRGGEGEVYSLVGAPTLVAKLLYPKSRTANKFEKVHSMIARPPSGAYDLVDGFPVLTWPRNLLYEKAGRTGRRKPFGYTMARVHERDFVPFYRITSATRRRELGGPNLTWDRLVLLGIRLCHVVRTLHRLDYAVGDMNDRNVLVSRRFTPLFMDTDSFQVPRPGGGHFPCVVGDQTYWPPEHLDVDYASYRGSRVTGDRYALGVLLFQLFMNGHRPYQARGARVDALESLVEKTRAGHFPWSAPQPRVLEPPAGAPGFESLPAPIRAMFERCFVTGHRKPSRRPTADDWYGALFRVRDEGFRTCPRHPAHVYGRNERECPWCKDPNNAFGLPAGRKRPRRPPPRPLAPKPKQAAASADQKAAAAKVAPRARTAPRKTKPPRGAAIQRTRQVRSRQRTLRSAWVAATFLLCATPLWVLPSIPMEPAKQVALFALTTLWVGAGGWALARKRFSARESATLAVGFIAAGGAIAAAAALAAGWILLDYANAAAGVGLGAGTFVLLERRQRRAYWPRPRGAIHASMAIGASYLPVAAVWVVTLV